MTDKQILQSLQQILDKFHSVFRGETKFKLAIRKTKTALSKHIPVKDVAFALSGQEIAEQKLADIVACTGRTKAFLYLAKDSGLDLKAVLTTNTKYLDTGNNNHTVPAVKMSDGKYHIFDPMCRFVDGQDFKRMLKQPVIIGQNVFHVLPSLTNDSYKVMDIVDATDLEKIKTLNDIIAKNRQNTAIPTKFIERD